MTTLRVINTIYKCLNVGFAHKFSFSRCNFNESSSGLFRALSDCECFTFSDFFEKIQNEIDPIFYEEDVEILNYQRSVLYGFCCDLFQRLLDEIGIDLGAMMGAAPSANLGNQNAVVEGSSEDAALDAEADALLARLTAM